MKEASGERPWGRRARWGWVLVCCWVGMAGPLRAQPELVLTDTVAVVPAAPYLALLRDEAGLLGVEDVATRADAFEVAGPGIPNLGYTRAAYWVRLRLHNAARTRGVWYLMVDEHDLASVDLYRPDPAGGFRVQRAGTALTHPTQIVRDLFHTFRLDLPPGARETLYLRVRTDDAMVLPVLLWAPEAYQARSRHEWLVVGLFLGLLGIMALYNALLYGWLRDRSYLYFALFLGLLVALELIEDGVQAYFWPTLNPLSHALVPVLMGLAGVTMLLFTRAFLQVERLHRGLDRAFRVMIAVGLLWLPVGVGLSYQAAMQGNNLLLMAGVVLNLGAAAYAWRRGQLEGRLYVLAWSPLMLWVVYFILSHSGVVPYWPWMDYGYQVTLALLVLLFSWSLVARIRNVERSRTEARQAALEKHMEALRLQDELTTALKQSKAQLEEQVAERTATLTATNERLRREVEQREQVTRQLHERRLRLQAHHNILAELAQRLADDWGRLDRSLQHITRAVAETLAVARVGVWLFEEGGTVLRCRELYDREADRHTQGAVLRAADAPGYFEALRREHLIAADEAVRDPRTCTLAERYLRPHGITSRLDVPVRLGGKVVGVVSLEHVGPPRLWLPEEQLFGTLVGDFVTLALEAHERWRIEQALRASEERWRLLFEHSPSASFILVGPQIVYVNQAAIRMMRARGPEELLGRPASDFIDPAFHDLHHQRMARLARGENPGVVRYELVPVRGERLVAEVRSMPIEYEGGPAVLAVLRDVTEAERHEAERRRFIEELEAKNRELERFTYTVSHDLKSPLFTIKGFLGLLREDVRTGDHASVEEDLVRIQNAADQMQHLLDGLLELSRIGRLANPSEQVNLTDLAREAVDLLAGRIAERGVTVTVAPDLPTVTGDRLRLLEVFQNLIDNAIKFMGDQPAPCVEVGVRHDDGPVFYVRDNGMGIEPAQQAHIFELFTRLDKSIEGTGIGLPLVRRIIEVHGGRVWVESEGPGTGATFCFTLGEQPG